MRIQTTAALDRGLEAWQLGADLAVCATKAAVEGVQAAARTVRKRRNYRPARDKLLACPEAETVLEQWHNLQEGRNALEALRFGAMLLNVSQYVDCSPIYGRGKHIVARNPGLKGWLRAHCREITYVTAMTYRKLAEVTCKAIHLPEFLPLEWVLPGTETMDGTRDLDPENARSGKRNRRECLRQIRECRDELRKLLEGAPNTNRLFGKLDALTHEHRHRARVRATACPSRGTVEQGDGPHLQDVPRTAPSI